MQPRSTMRPVALAILIAGSSSVDAACLGTVFRDSFEDLSQNHYEVELVISQLGGRSASFQLDGGETITATGDGTYCFSEQVQGGQPYQVEITAQPDTGDACGGDLAGVAAGPISIAVSCALQRTEWEQFNWDEADWN